MEKINIFTFPMMCLFLFSCEENAEINNPYITKSVDFSCISIPVPEDAYMYPIVPGTDEWVGLHKKGMDEVLKACQVPEDTLRKLSTQAVIQAFFDYPFVMDMYASSSSLLNGFKQSCEFNSAYPELLKRKDAGTCLLDRYLLLNPTGCNGATLVAGLYEMLLAQSVFYSQLNAEKKKELVKAALVKIKKREDYDSLLAHHNQTTCLLIGRIMISAGFPPFTKEVANNKELAQYLETQSLYNYYDNILSFANKFIK